MGPHLKFRFLLGNASEKRLAFRVSLPPHFDLRYSLRRGSVLPTRTPAMHFDKPSPACRTCLERRKATAWPRSNNGEVIS